MNWFMGWRSVVDFVVLCLALYGTLLWARGARAVRLALAVIALLIASQFAQAERLVLSSWILFMAALLVGLALLVVFQSEVRRALTRLDSAVLRPSRRRWLEDPARQHVVDAAFALARAGEGALLVLPAGDPVDELVDGGVTLDAAVSRPLLEALFQKTSPLHDGAAVVANGRVAQAGAILPLSVRADLPEAFGTRHRAATGLAERCDAVVVVVSEERGEVSVVRGTRVEKAASPERLGALLKESSARTGYLVAGRFWRHAAGNAPLALAAVALAALAWGVAISPRRSVIRTAAVPVVLELPSGQEQATQSVNTLVVQLRGPLWILDTRAVDDIAVHLAVPESARSSPVVVRVRPEDFVLPPGVTVERVTPPSVTVRLGR